MHQADWLQQRVSRAKLMDIDIVVCHLLKKRKSGAIPAQDMSTVKLIPVSFRM
jgi:hypothetical protein